MTLDSSKVDAIADAASKLAGRFDSVMARRADDWSPEARKAAAEARKGGGSRMSHRQSKAHEQKYAQGQAREQHEKNTSREYERSHSLKEHTKQNASNKD